MADLCPSTPTTSLLNSHDCLTSAANRESVQCWLSVFIWVQLLSCRFCTRLTLKHTYQSSEHFVFAYTDEVPFVLACSRTLGQSESHWVLAFINTCCPVQIITLKYLFLPSLCFSQTLLCSSGSCLYNSELLAATPSPVVFCHNDVQEGKTFFCFNHILLSRCSLILTPLILDDWSTVWLCWHIA